MRKKEPLPGWVWPVLILAALVGTVVLTRCDIQHATEADLHPITPDSGGAP